MFDFLDRYGVPIKYGVIGYLLGFIVAFFVYAWNQTDPMMAFAITPIICSVAAYIGGMLQDRKNKQQTQTGSDSAGG